MKIVLSVFALLFSLSLSAQTHSCCKLAPTTEMAMLAADPAFAALHAEPLPFPNPDALRGAIITYKATDGLDANGYLVKGKDTTKILFVFHEWWGLNDYIKREADRLSADLGISAFAIDLYDGKVAATREDAQKYAQALKNERGIAIINGAYVHFGNKRYATIGWCMGGSWSMKAALTGMNYHVDACVIYYGMPERNPDVLAMLNAPVLGIFAKRDEGITPAVVKEAQEAFRKAGKKITVHSYDAVHAFANPSNPNYDRKSAGDAYKKTLTFLKNQLEIK